MNKTTNQFGNVSYNPQVPTYIQPRILEEFVGDDGELQYILDNGRTSPARLYNGLWLPKKGIVNMKAKDGNPDRRKIS